ncbi:cytochrome c oxidase assembly protein COX20, mitochondrial isoform X2 [Corythoichthys intestinalis]|uniref:cytochrome c oxidase assembly protein COX20, mitochondrial isoform X2 n=1 Tax=Corythoichthys intestinalis TaxID=161448 RepID=UPI0025A6639B|nr:cytochrome c oxidase assembly protein COX20, mitochondrial isoform X2 [Corythoichthys intestinalis]XP_061794043.1 cytochrome c oxidase assembly protein COX20, mitochondrial-like [Nerophis lumbriciformis]
MSQEEETSNEKSYRLLGILDVQKTPCAREAVLQGAGASLAAGLLHFLATSRLKRSFHVGAGGFVLGTLASWCYCRWSYARLRAQQRIFRQGIQNQMIYQGTAADPASAAQSSPNVSAR